MMATLSLMILILSIIVFVLITVLWRINEKAETLYAMQRMQVREMRRSPLKFPIPPPPPAPSKANLRHTEKLIRDSRDNVIKLQRKNVIFMKSFKPKKKGPRK